MGQVGLSRPWETILIALCKVETSGTQGWKDLEVTSNLKPTKVGDYD